MWNLKTSSKLLKELELQRNYNHHQAQLERINKKRKPFSHLNKIEVSNLNNKYDKLKVSEIH